MKPVLIAAAAVSALGFAAPAFADTASTNVVINGVNDPKCSVSASGATVTLASDSISDANGMLSGNLKGAIVTALNNNGLSAWCTGGHNKIVVSRTALQTGGGVQGSDQFARAVVYDVVLSMAGAVRSEAPTDAGLVDGTEDGAANVNGPNVTIGPFGPTGAGSAMTFTYQDAPGDPSEVSDGQGAAQLPRTSYSQISGFRLLAGSYTSTVTVSITPGL